MYGSLVMLSRDRLQSEPIWCEVFKRDEQFLNHRARPSIDLRILQGPMPVQHLGGPAEWVMIEASQSYFLPYQAVIGAMQRLGAAPIAPGPAVDGEAPPQTLLPFARHLVEVQQQVRAPVYLRPAGAARYDMRCIYPELQPRSGSATFDITAPWPLAAQLDTQATMDAAQTSALKHLLTKEVAVVQGPPGTGKVSCAFARGTHIEQFIGVLARCPGLSQSAHAAMFVFAVAIPNLFRRSSRSRPCAFFSTRTTGVCAATAGRSSWWRSRITRWTSCWRACSNSRPTSSAWDRDRRAKRCRRNRCTRRARATRKLNGAPVATLRGA